MALLHRIKSYSLYSGKLTLISIHEPQKCMGSQALVNGVSGKYGSSHVGQ